MKQLTVVKNIKEIAYQATKSKNIRGEEVGLHTSSKIFNLLDEHLVHIIMIGIEKAEKENRRTLMDRDIMAAIQDFKTK